MRLVSPTDGETQKQGMAKAKSFMLGLRAGRADLLIVVQESAEGIVVWLTGGAGESLQCRKAEKRIGRAAGKRGNGSLHSTGTATGFAGALGLEFFGDEFRVSHQSQRTPGGVSSSEGSSCRISVGCGYGLGEIL